MAQELASCLNEQGVQAHVEGAGVHWQVNAKHNARTARVHCFWYDMPTGLILGMNAANARVSFKQPFFKRLFKHFFRRRRKQYMGPEYLTLLHDEGQEVACGRTHELHEATQSVQMWMQGASLGEVWSTVPYIDARRRAMQPAIDQLGEREWALTGDPTYELWVHSKGRSCRIVRDGEHYACRLLLGQAVAARIQPLVDVQEAVDVWLDQKASIRLLPKLLDHVSVARHAELLDTTPAAWHWAHVRERIADPKDVLAPLAPFLEMLSQNPMTTAFYSFSSLNRFVFSSSSHYPWVGDGLPVLAPAKEQGMVWVDEELMSYEAALRKVEALLKEAPHAPFFGTATHLCFKELCAALKSRGSRLEPRFIHRQQWLDLVITAKDRTCQFFDDVTRVGFIEGEQEVSVSWSTQDDAVCACIAFLEEGATLDEIKKRSDQGTGKG